MLLPDGFEAGRKVDIPFAHADVFDLLSYLTIADLPSEHKFVTFRVAQVSFSGGPFVMIGAEVLRDQEDVIYRMENDWRVSPISQDQSKEIELLLSA